MRLGAPRVVLSTAERNEAARTNDGGDSIENGRFGFGAVHDDTNHWS